MTTFTFAYTMLSILRNNLCHLVFCGTLLAVIAASETGFAAENNRQYAQYSWWWLFYESGTVTGEDYYIYRPLFLHNQTDRRIYEAVLPPALWWKYETKGNIVHKGLFGFYGDVDYTHPSGTPDYDLGLFPLFFYGSSPEARDNYFMLWPVGGTIRGKLAQDNISPWIFPGVALFFLFPPSGMVQIGLYAGLSLIPAWVSYNDGAYQAHGIFWPLIQWGKSPVRNDMRILPFYAHNTKKDMYDTRNILLLFNYREDYTPRNTQHTFLAVPFFGRRWNSDRLAGGSTLLWPFFSWGYDKKRGDFELNFPWPLVQYQRCQDPDIDKRIFFPFYGYYRYENKETEFITPLYISLKRDSVNMKSEYYVNFLLFWWFKRDYPRTPHEYYGHQWRYFKIWPLFHYEYNDLGDTHISALSLPLLWFRDPSGYERIYAPFWTLFEYRATRDGTQHLGLLLRLYYQTWGEDFFKSKVPLIYSYASYKGEITDCTILASMFGYEVTTTETRLRLLWIPVSIGEGNPELAGLEPQTPPQPLMDTASAAELGLLGYQSGARGFCFRL